VPKSGGGGGGSSSSSPTILTTLLSIIFRNEGIYLWLVRWLAPYTWSCRCRTLRSTLPRMMRYLCGYDDNTNIPTNHHLAIGSNRGGGGGDDGSGVGHQEQTRGMSTNKQFAIDKETTTATSNDNDKSSSIHSTCGRIYRPTLATMATAPLEHIRTRQSSVVAAAIPTTLEGGGSNSSGTARSSSIVIPGMIEELKYLTRTRGISSLPSMPVWYPHYGEMFPFRHCIGYSLNDVEMHCPMMIVMIY
jgi:hypothetical protein